MPLHSELISPYFDLYYDIIAQMMEQQFSPQKAKDFMLLCPLNFRLDQQKAESFDLPKVKELIQLTESM